MSILESARSEMDLARVPGEDRDVILSCLSAFLSHFDSGGAVSVAGPMLVRLLQGAPLTPLTGEDDEWEDKSEYGPDPAGTLYQNKRASSVFKRRSDDGSYTYYDVARAGETPASEGGGFHTITQFPYMPEAEFTSPLVEVREKPGHPGLEHHADDLQQSGG